MELKNIKYSFLNINRPRELKELPKENDCFHIITKKQHEGFEFAELLQKADEFLLFYASIEKKHAEFFTKYKSKHLASVWVIKKNESILDVFKEKKIREQHAKIICAKIKTDYYVVQGSGNLSRGGNIENYQFYNSKKLYDFYNKKYTEI